MFVVSKSSSMLWPLIKTNILSDWRNPVAILGAIFFQFTICFVSFLFTGSELNELYWALLFWLIVLISATGMTLHNIRDVHSSTYGYYYQIGSAVQVFLAKFVYHACLILGVIVLNYVLFHLLFDSYDINFTHLFLLAFLAALALSSLLTIIAFLAGFADHQGVLMNALVYPLSIPILLIAVRQTYMWLTGADVNIWSGNMTIILGISLVFFSTCISFFPYLWRR